MTVGVGPLSSVVPLIVVVLFDSEVVRGGTFHGTGSAFVPLVLALLGAIGRGGFRSV